MSSGDKTKLNNCLQVSTLYNNASGTNGTVTLSSSIANFSKIRISFKTNDGEISSKIINISGSSLTTHLSYIKSDTSSHAWLKSKSALLNGTSISNSGYIEFVFHDSNKASSNYIYITKVEGYKI